MVMSSSRARSDSFEGARVLILSGESTGCAGTCLGRAADGERWAVSPDESERIVDLTFEEDFGLLLDLSGKVERK